MQVRRAVLGDAHVERGLQHITPFNEEFQDLISRHAWGDIWTRSGLSRHTRSLIAIARNRGLQRFSMRGLDKARSVLLWYALAHNLMRMVELAPGLVGGLRGCEKTPAYCDRLQTPAADVALRERSAAE